MTALVAGLSSCSNKAVVKGSFQDAPASGTVLVKTVEGSLMQTIDTVKVAENGTFTYKYDAVKGQPEFVYLYCGDTKVASLLLASGDKVSVKCDTVGLWTVSGSEDCEKLREVELRHALISSSDVVTGRQFVDYYRSMVRYVLENSHSLVVVPVFYQKIGDVPVFAQPADGVLMGNVADSLATVYPDSKYVKMLRSVAKARDNELALSYRLSEAEVVEYPELVLPDVNGKNVALTSVQTGKTLVVFWDATDPGNKIFNQEVLKPLYEKYQAKGLGIYAVNVGLDKANWAMVVREQGLKWTNVCDTKGNSLYLYGVSQTPTVFLISNGKLKRINNIALRSIDSEL